jgi:hypothetical protein
LAAHLLNSNFIFLSMGHRRRLNERQVLLMYSFANRSNSSAMDRCRVSELISVRCCLDFSLQNAADKEASNFKFSKHGSQFIRVSNSAKSSWLVLAVWVSVKSARRHIFHQDTSYGPRRPHAVSKALGRYLCWLIRQWKPAIVGHKICHSFWQDRFFLPLNHSIWSMMSYRSFFILKMNSYLRWGLHWSSYGSVLCRGLIDT